MNKFVRYWLPLLLYCMAIITVSMLVRPPATLARTFGDKPLHMVEYGLLSLLATRALLGSVAGMRRLPAWFLAVGFCLVVGTVDELVQYLIPARKSEWLDIVADASGGAMGATLYLILKMLHTRLSNELSAP